MYKDVKFSRDYYFRIYIFKRINFIPNYTGEKHQLFTSQKITQLTGGIYVFLIIIYIFSFNLEFLIFSFLMIGSFL